ncbi:hypothetical protein VNO77_11459 [Canavalia gladiata]|uniref:Actin-binding transcription modulator n=1 Tax=Canavalia gladiata TaxID=3824 RepID=A0AAN9QVA6_CANGL
MSTIYTDQMVDESNCSETKLREEKNEEEEELQKLLVPDVQDLPLTPPSAVETNFVTYFALGGITAVDFNVGKSDRSGVKVTGKRKKNAQHFESNTALCKVSTKNDTYIVRCCVKGSLLEVNQQLIKHPELLNVSYITSHYAVIHTVIAVADREGYIAIIMPKPADWLKVKASLVSLQEYKKLREVDEIEKFLGAEDGEKPPIPCHWCLPSDRVMLDLDKYLTP